MKMLEFRIGSDNGLAPNRWQAIIWTNDDPVQWRKYESLDLNELSHQVTTSIDAAMMSNPVFDTLRLRQMWFL